MFVANGNSISAINDTTNSITTTIPVGDNPFGIAYDPAKEEMFVANANSNSISVISNANVGDLTVPEFGPISYLILAVSAKTGLRFMPRQ